MAGILHHQIQTNKQQILGLMQQPLNLLLLVVVHGVSKATINLWQQVMNGVRKMQLLVNLHLILGHPLLQLLHLLKHLQMNGTNLQKQHKLMEVGEVLLLKVKLNLQQLPTLGQMQHKMINHQHQILGQMQEQVNSLQLQILGQLQNKQHLPVVMHGEVKLQPPVVMQHKLLQILGLQNPFNLLQQLIHGAPQMQ